MALALREQFNKDLAFGKKAEEIVFNYFSSIDDKHTYIDVSDKSFYYHLGDIIAVDRETKEQILIEVKNDSCIHRTGNVVCEEWVHYKSTGQTKNGNIHNNNDIYIVVSQEQRKIYVMDMKVLKRIYLNGRYKEFDYAHQASGCFLVSLDSIRANGGLIAILDY